MRIVKVRQIVGIAVILLGSGCLQGCKDSAQTLNDRMKRHNHLYINDLFQLRKQTLAQVEHDYGIEGDTDSKSLWHYLGKYTSDEGYIYDSWSFRTTKADDDPNGCLSMMSCFDLNGNTMIRYVTDDIAYVPTVIATLDSTKLFKHEVQRSDKDGASSNSYTYEGGNIAVIIYCPKTITTKHPSVVGVTSSADYKKIMEGQIHFGSH